MGIFRKTHDLAGLGFKELFERGLLGRGIIVSIRPMSVSPGATAYSSRVCMFTVEVALDDVPRYNATCLQTVSATSLPQLMMPDATIAVRVNPDDHSHIALSLGEQPPTVVTMAGPGDPTTGSAARILDLGVLCKAVIVQTQSLGMRSSTGKDMYAFVLAVMAEGRPQFEIQLASPVPAPALPLLYPGNTVPAKRMPDGDDHELVIDWDAALAQLHSATG